MAYDSSISKNDWMRNKGTGASYHLSEASLSITKIQKLFKDKVLSEDLFNIFDESIGAYPLNDNDLYNFGVRAKKAGVLLILPFYGNRHRNVFIYGKFFTLSFYKKKAFNFE